MRDYKATAWEKKLKIIFDEIDHILEEEYAEKFPRHPARPACGTTSNPEMDGLFNVGASFSAGFGSKHGPGYVVDIRLSTLARIPEPLKNELQKKVKELLTEKLPAIFPGKELHVVEEQSNLRIIGDLSFD